MKNSFEKEFRPQGEKEKNRPTPEDIRNQLNLIRRMDSKERKIYVADLRDLLTLGGLEKGEDKEALENVRNLSFKNWEDDDIQELLRRIEEEGLDQG